MGIVFKTGWVQWITVGSSSMKNLNNNKTVFQVGKTFVGTCGAFKKLRAC